MNGSCFFIVNPRSANGKTEKWWRELLPSLKQRNLDFDWACTTGPFSAADIARQAVERGFRTIVAVGGDGTAYEVLNGIFRDDRLLDPGLKLAVWPRGTGCDLGRMLRLPREADALLETLIRGDSIRVDAGRAEFIGCDGFKTVRYFLNVAEAGLGGETVARVNRTSKAFGGFISFLWGTALSILFYQSKTMRITIDDKFFREEKTTLVACGNGCCFGGGMRICPEADLSDGYFDITGVTAADRLTLLRNLLGVYRGSHLTLPQVWHCRGKNVVIESEERVLVNLDGEQPGTLRGKFTLLAGALEMII